MQWYYAQDNQQKGPVDDAGLKQMIQAGRLGASDLVWNDTFGSEWRRIGAVPELSPPLTSDALQTPGLPLAGPQGQTPNRDLMSQARERLAGCWGTAVGITAIYFAISLAIAFIPYISNIISLFVMPPMMVGLALFSLAIIRGRPVEVGVLFKGFERYWPPVGAYVLIALLTLLWVLPGVVLIATGAFFMARGTEEIGLAFLIPGSLLLLVLSVLAQLRYGLAYFVLADVGGGPLEAIRRSVSLMRGNQWKLFCLGLRFIGWILLAMLTCGIGFLWLVPYMNTSEAAFYEDVRT